MQNGQWKRRHRNTRYRRFRWERLLLVAASAALVVVGLVKLIRYTDDYISAQQTAQELRQAYQQEITETAAPAPSPVPATPAPTQAQSTQAPAPTAVARLNAMPYPENPRLQISSQFKALRKENKDIVGWLNLGGLLDEAVVQRDEVYYMDHDALGKKNVNGAIFLDSGVSLNTRPYTCVLYGHNMKTGAMFGCLRNYENITYYHSNPFITFDTMYENGRYVIFAVGMVNTVERVKNYVNIYSLLSDNLQERQSVIDALVKASVFSNSVDVRPDDQILLLVTCVDHDNERRVVAARRIRGGENEEELKLAVGQNRKR